MAERLRKSEESHEENRPLADRTSSHIEQSKNLATCIDHTKNDSDKRKDNNLSKA
ncbi:hypothetical protein PCANC_25942 [Puccinia coronata f. sp. avenae]|uniref:Uncharacterized protein n=1 Tax=Puccinia coronata f. sp. avenae TaxID=200324 RepID=A0A2N5U6C8_9BASI|nr:hypothetical protein PCANC_25942 [Puccinia coronata f. sp. avenae]